ncbi:MAG TPA: hypothetical protein VG435_10660 [Acidimicrobiales bacterium]|nr:hypothetical protein [Acidimicrobiales bacterium]
MASIGIGLVSGGPPASAAPVGSSVRAGAVTPTPATAGSNSSYAIALTPTTALPAGGTITFVAPAGTDFVGCTSCAGLYSIAVASGTAPTVTSADATSTDSSNNNRVVLTISGTVAAGDQMTVTTHETTNPTAASTTETLSESTSTDTAPASSPDYTITSSTAASIGVVSGTPQSAQVGTAFTDPLSVMVEDAYGNPVANQSVTFTAPASAPSGTFGSCSSNPHTYQCVAQTDSSGVATSSTFTADGSSGSYTVTATTATTSGTGAANFDLTNTAVPPSSVTPGAATVSTSTAGATGVTYTVKFFPTTAVPNGGTGTITLTAPAGTALPAAAGEYSITYGSGPTDVVVDSVAVSSTGSSSTTNQAVITVTAPLTVDAIPAGTTVTVTIAGVANPTLAGVYSIEESTSTQPGPVASTPAYAITPAAASTLVIAAGDDQSATVGNQFATPLTVTAEDQYGNPVPSTNVTFTVPAAPAGQPGGTLPSGTTQTNPTNAQGVATSSPVTADHTTGSWTATAAITGQAGTAVTFHLTNAAGPAATITATSGSGQSATVGTAFAAPLTAKVADQYGNAVPGATVTLTAPSSGPSGTFAGAQTTDSGATGTSGQFTSSTFTANAEVGSYSVVASVTGAGTPADFALTNNADVANGLSVVSGSGQSAHVGQDFAGPLVVKVTDARGMDLAGWPVTFNLPASAPGATFAGDRTSATVLTGSDGEAVSPTIIAALTPGSYDATASTTVGANSTSVSFALANTEGYWLAGTDGSIQPFGDAAFFGSTAGVKLAQPVVAVAAVPNGSGYWMVATDGGVFNFGPGAKFHGSTGGVKLVKPIVGMASTPTGNGYWLVASDGGVFAFGDARFHGSTGGVKLDQPIVGMTPTPTGNGYWLVASDGGIFAFGDAKFYGSTGSTRLNQPVVGMAAAPGGSGYWLVASDGGIFAFGPGAHFYGSTGSVNLAQPIVGMTAAPSGHGYWFVAHDGGVFNFGPDAKFEGSGSGVGEPVVGMAQG